jgi:hypothetical protein
VDLIRHGEARIGSEKPDGVVTPIVGQATLGEATPRDVMVNGQELDTRHAQRAQVLEDRFGAQAEVRAPQTLRDVGMAHGHPFHVTLVNHRLIPRDLGTVIALPIERGVDHHALGHGSAGSDRRASDLHRCR